MTRAPFQVLVLAFRRVGPGEAEYAVLRRSDMSVWQGIAGGGETEESPAEAARREACEELGIPAATPVYPLQATASIPVRFFKDRKGWPADLYVIPEYAFAADTTGVDAALSDEHTKIHWLPYEKAAECLRWDSNKVALGELHERLSRDDLPPPA